MSENPNAPQLGPVERKEIASEIWRILCLHSRNISIAFTPDNVTIYVPLKDLHELGNDSEVILGSIEEGGVYVESVLAVKNRDRKKGSTSP